MQCAPTNKSFAHSLDRGAFDNKTVSFEEHFRMEHNLWHYLYFIVLIKVKDPTEFTGPESFVYEMVKVINIFNTTKLPNLLLYLN